MFKYEQNSGHDKLVRILRTLEADILICGSIGLPAQVILEGARIKFFGGVSGDADKAVEDYLAGNLVYDPHIRCKYEKVCGYH